jgi:hypothetical protein
MDLGAMQGTRKEENKAIQRFSRKMKQQSSSSLIYH